MSRHAQNIVGHVRRPALCGPLFAASLVPILIVLVACGAGRTEAPHALAMKPRSAQITWTDARELIRGCKARAIGQTHGRLVVVTLRDGSSRWAYEPQIDEIFHEVNRLGANCRPSTIWTE